jgi:hypothetical protein
VRVNAANVAKDVPVTTSTSQKRWNPSDRWSTTAVLAGRANTPQNLESSDSDHRLEQDLRPHDPRSPMDPNASPQPNLPVGSTDPDNSHSLPVDPPPSEHDDLQFDMDLNDHDLPRLSQEAIDGPDSGSHSTGSPTHSDFHHSTDYPWPSDNEEAGVLPSPSQSHDFNPPLHENLDDIPFNLLVIPHLHPPSPMGLSEPRLDWWQSPAADSRLTMSDPGPSTMLYSSDSDESIGTNSPERLSPQDPGPPTHPPPSPGPLQHDSENVLSELFRYGRFKRRISGSRSVKAAQRELQDTLDSSEFVSAPAFPFQRP